jgi:hypothetical protein
MADTAVTDLDVLAASLDHLARRFCEDEADARPLTAQRMDAKLRATLVPW